MRKFDSGAIRGDNSTKVNPKYVLTEYVQLMLTPYVSTNLYIPSVVSFSHNTLVEGTDRVYSLCLLLLDKEYGEYNVEKYDAYFSDVCMRLGRVLTQGAKVYGDWNWQQGFPREDIVESLLRHFWKYHINTLGLVRATDMSQFDNINYNEDEDHFAHTLYNVMLILYGSDYGWFSE